MGAALVRQFQRGAARHRHLPPGQPRISVARGLEKEGQSKSRRQAGDHGRRLSRHGGRHRLAHHHGQRPVGARLGRRRHRGGSRHARPAAVDDVAGSDRIQTVRQAQGRRHRHRPGAHRHRNAAQARRGRQVRRVFRARPHASDHRRPRHARQHGAGIRRHLRLLADRRRHHPYSQGHHRPTDVIKLVEAYAKAQGMFASRPRPTRCSPTYSSSISARSNPRSPAPSVRRTTSSLKEVKAGFTASMEKEFGRAAS